MQITLYAHIRKTKRKIENDLSWYNPVSKKIEYYRASRLEFQYDLNTKQTRVRPIIEEGYEYCDSWPDIQDFISKNRNFIDIQDSSRKSVAFEIDDYHWPRIKKQLTDLNIRYQIEDEVKDDNKRRNSR